MTSKILTLIEEQTILMQKSKQREIRLSKLNENTLAANVSLILIKREDFCF